MTDILRQTHDGFPVPQERIAVFFLQPQCNMTCSFCITEDGFAPMTMAQAMGLLRFLKSAGIGNVILGGGEPFHWKPGAMELASAAKAMGFFVQAGTNGLKLPEGYADAPEIDRYILPLESVSVRIHDSLRHYPTGHHALIRDRLDVLGRSGKSVTVSTVVTSVNISGLSDLGAFLSEYHRLFGNLHAWHLYRMLPVGRGGARSGDRLGVAQDEYHAACARLRGEVSGIHIIKRPNMLNSKAVGFFWMEGGGIRCRARNPSEFGFASGWAYRGRVL